MATGGVSPPDSPPDSRPDSPSPRSAPRSVSPPPGWTGPKRLDGLDKFFAGQAVQNRKKGKVSEFKYMERPRGRKNIEARREYREEVEQRKAYPLSAVVRRVEEEGEKIAAICGTIIGSKKSTAETRPQAITNYIAELKASLYQIKLVKQQRNDALPDFFHVVFHEIDRELAELKFDQLSVRDCFLEIRMQIYRILEYTHATLQQSPQPERSRSASPAPQQRSASPAPRRSTSSSPQPRPQSPLTQPLSHRSRPHSPQQSPQSPQPRPLSPCIVLEDPRDQQLMQTPQNQQLLSMLHHYTTLSDSQRDYVNLQLATLPQHIRDYLRSRFNMEHQDHQQQHQLSVKLYHQRKEQQARREREKEEALRERMEEESRRKELQRRRQDEMYELKRQYEQQQRRQQNPQQGPRSYNQYLQEQRQQQQHQQQQQQRTEQLYPRQIDQYHLQRLEQRQQQPLMFSPQEEELRELIQNFNNLTIQEQAALQQTIQQLPAQEREKLQYQIQLQQMQQHRR